MGRGPASVLRVCTDKSGTDLAHAATRNAVGGKRLYRVQSDARGKLKMRLPGQSRCLPPYARATRSPVLTGRMAILLCAHRDSRYCNLAHGATGTALCDAWY
eukprot:1759070-Rhodomonas_salina.1